MTPDEARARLVAELAGSGTLDEAGHFYLQNGYHPDRPNNVSVVAQQAKTRSGEKAGAPANATETDVTAETLMERLRAAPHCVRISDPDPASRAAWRRAIHAAKERDLVPVGAHLRHAGRDRGDLVIELVNGVHPDLKYRAARPKIDIPSSADGRHPVIVALRRRRQIAGISAESRDRATRLVQALVAEWTHRGNTVKLGSGEWLHLEMNVRKSHFVLKMHEESELQDRMPSLDEIEQRITYPWQRIRPEKTWLGTGRLHIEIDHDWAYSGHRRNWSDRSRWSLEDKLLDILDELEKRARLSEEKHARRVAEEQQRQRSWKNAMDRAKALFEEQVRADALEAQVDAWEKANRIRRFCDVAESARAESRAGYTGTVEWLEWARRYADRIDPTHGPLEPPEIPNPSREDLRPFLGRWSPYGPDSR